MSSDKNCNVKEFSKILGEVSAIITSVTAPARKNVLWAKPSLITEGKFDLYFWNGVGWLLLINSSGDFSGNFDTLLDGAIEMAITQGGLPSGTTVEDLRGDSLISLWERFLFPNEHPVYEPPEALISGSTPYLVELSQTKSITFNATFDQGDAGAITAYDLLKNNVSISNSQSYTDVDAVLDEPGTIVYKGRFAFADGPVLDDSYGNPDPTGQILAGLIDTNILTYKWILPIYYGSDADGISIDPTTGTKLLVEITGTTLTITFPSDGPAFYYLAVPADTPEFIKYFITEISKGSMGTGNAWEPSVPITITDGAFVAKDFDLYITGYVTQFNLPVQFKQT